MSQATSAVWSGIPVQNKPRLGWQPDLDLPASGGRNELAAEFRFEKSTVAALTRDQIDQMESDDLIQVVRAVSMPFFRTVAEHRLKLLDVLTLRRLAYLARRTCRNQGY
jgi:hypothetical protein